MEKITSKDKIGFSIGSKLVIIILFMIVISLGTVIALVYKVIHQNLLNTAYENNMEINRRCATEAESAIINIKTSIQVLMHTAPSKETIDYFFSQNKQIAAFYYTLPSKKEQVFINADFFSARGINKDKAESYFNEQKFVLGQAAAGESLLLNASPFFNSPCIALFFPANGAGAVIFSSEAINSNFNFGLNQSFIINSRGDIIAVSDTDILNKAVNVAGEKFVYDIVSGKDHSKQQLLKADLGFLYGDYSKKRSFILTGAEKLLDKLDIKIGGMSEYFLSFTKLNTAGAVVITSAEYDKVFESINTAALRSIYFTAAFLAAGMLFIWLFSKTISVPIKSLAQAAQKIENGIFDFVLQPKGNDEITMLTGRFNKMCKSLNFYGSFINKDIAVRAMRGDIKPGGYPKQAAVFFSDISGFKAKIEQIRSVYGSGAPDKIVTWMNEYFAKMADCIEKTNGIIDKFIGDAIMAHWGTAHSAGNLRKDAFNCIKTALMMRKELFYLNQQRDEYDIGNPSIRIGCGINTGLVTAGQLGSETRKEYTVIGEPVFLAAGIEAYADPLGTDILISEDTWKLVGDKFITEEMPPVTIEGKKDPVRVFAVVNFHGEEKGPQTLAEVRELLGIKMQDADNIDYIEEIEELTELTD